MGCPTPKPFDGDWPDDPSLRFLVYWSLRRKELCNPSLCVERQDEEDRCETCPLTRLEDTLKMERGRLLRRALDIRALIRLGVTITLEEIAGDEMYSMLIIDEEQNRYESEQANKK